MNKDFLQTELDSFKKHGIDLKQKDYNRKMINDILKEHKYCAMVESSFCCYGEEKSCWQELYFDGNWNYTYKKIKKMIKKTFDEFEEYLLNKEDFGDRFFIYETENYIIAYVYLRDVLQLDYTMFFCKTEKQADEFSLGS